MEAGMSATVRIQNPFPGLRPFKTEESTLFFGRDEQIGEALDRMLRQKLLAVVGVSGCGKSSLVTAGMVPALEMGLAGDPDLHWRTATMRPGDGPLRELARCLGFGEALAERTYGLLEAVENHLPPGENILLLVDQFEEIFPFRDRKLLEGGGSEADLFVSYLLRAAQDPAGRIYILLTMRSDYLGECAKFHQLPEALNDGQYLVPRMTRQQLQQAIEGPLEAAGVTMHPALVQELLNQCDEEPDNLPLLQHLLRRMFERWEAEGAEGPITPAMAKRVGGLTRALEQDAEEEVCNRLSSDEMRVAEVLFRRITESRRQSEREEDDRPVRRPQTVADLAQLAGVEETALLRVVRRFEDRGLLVLRHTDQGDKVDLPHECLCLRWTRLKAWIREESEDAKKLRFLWDATERRAPLSGLALDEALEWERNGRLGAAWCSRYLSGEQITAVAAWVADSHRVVGEVAERERRAEEAERRREVEKRTLAEAEARREMRSRRVRVVALLSGVLSLAFAGLGVWAYTQKVLATEQSRLATEQSRRATSEARDAETQRNRATTALADAEDQKEYAEQQRRAAEESEKKAVAAAEQAEANYMEYLAAKLALQSAEVFREEPSGLEKAVLLAIESSRIKPTSEGDEALRRSLSLLPIKPSRSEKYEYAAGEPVALSPDGKWIATGGTDGTARVLELTTKKALTRLGKLAQVDAVALSGDGKWLAAGSADGTARVLEVTTDKEVARFENLGKMSAVALSLDGKWLAAGSDDGTARVKDVTTQKETAQLANLGRVSAVALSPDGKRLAVGSDSGTVRVMEAEKEAARLENLGKVTAVALSPDGKWLATGSADKTARVWELPAGKEVTRLPHEGAVRAVAFTPDGKWVNTWSDDQRAQAMEAPSARQLVRLQNDSEPNKEVEANAIAFSRDGRLVATGSVDHIARVIEASSGQVVQSSRAFDGDVSAVAFSPDGKSLTIRTSDKAYRMEVATGADLPVPADERIVYAMAFSPDGRLLAAGGKDGKVRITDASKGLLVKEVDHQAIVYGLAFSPDGKWLLTGGDAGTARLWNSATGVETKSARINYPRARVYATAFSADGKWLATGSGSNAKVTEAASGRELYHIEIDAALFAAVHFTQDGRWLETIHQVSNDDKNLIYTRHPLNTEDLIREACGKLTRNLTKDEWKQQQPKDIPYRQTCPNLP